MERFIYEQLSDSLLQIQNRYGEDIGRKTAIKKNEYKLLLSDSQGRIVQELMIDDTPTGDTSGVKTYRYDQQGNCIQIRWSYYSMIIDSLYTYNEESLMVREVVERSSAYDPESVQKIKEVVCQYNRSGNAAFKNAHTT